MVVVPVVLWMLGVVGLVVVSGQELESKNMWDPNSRKRGYLIPSSLELEAVATSCFFLWALKVAELHAGWTGMCSMNIVEEAAVENVRLFCAQLSLHSCEMVPWAVRNESGSIAQSPK